MLPSMEDGPMVMLFPSVGVGSGVAVTVGVAVAVTVAVAVGVAVGVAVAVTVGVTVGVAVSVGVTVSVAVGVAVAVTVGVTVGVAVSVGVTVSVAVGVAVAVTVGVTVGVGVGVGVSVSVDVTVGVAVGVALALTVGVTVGVAVSVGVTVSVRVGVGSLHSLLQPSPSVVLPSSHSSPSFTHSMPSPQRSILHVEQPSHGVSLPSSHSSPQSASTMPSPHLGSSLHESLQSWHAGVPAMVSHSSPWFGHTMPSPQRSILQFGEQPSHWSLLPSSHSSSGLFTIPSPQRVISGQIEMPRCPGKTSVLEIGTRTTFWKVSVVTLKSVLPSPSASVTQAWGTSAPIAVVYTRTRARSPGEISGISPMKVATNLIATVPNGRLWTELKLIGSPFMSTSANVPGYGPAVNGPRQVLTVESPNALSTLRATGVKCRFWKAWSSITRLPRVGVARLLPMTIVPVTTLAVVSRLPAFPSGHGVTTVSMRAVARRPAQG